MKCWYKKGKLHFDDEARSLIKRFAKKQHKTPKQIVIAALKRGVKRLKNTDKTGA